MKKNSKIPIIITLILVTFLLTGCSENKQEDLKAKVSEELDYMNIKTINMLNKLNNITYEAYTITSRQVKPSEEQKQGENQGSSGKSSQNSGQDSGQGEKGENSGSTNGQQSEGEKENDKIYTTNMIKETELGKDRNTIDWSSIKNEVELVNESWSTITLDLYSLNVKGDTILDFSDKLNTTMIAIKNEDKAQSLATLADLYSSIPEFLKEINADKNIQKIRQTQSNVINAYVLAEDMGNIKIGEHLEKANTIYAEVMNDIDYTKNKTQKTNKVYILLNELNNSVNQKDSDVFFIKYKEFMKEVDEIQ